MPPSRRPVRIANCSGATPDPGDLMFKQAVGGPVDVITGDYLAEANIAANAVAYAAGKHPGWMPTAWDGLQKSLDAIAKRKIKVIINGGSLNPRGLAEATQDLVAKRGHHDLKVAWVEGDDLLSQAQELLRPDDDAGRGKLPHFDADNDKVQLARDTDTFLNDPEKKLVAANAYLGCRAIRRGLDEGADIIICGRVADASPVMGAAAWWHGWRDDEWNVLAGALVAGHLIECSTYGTGGNFAGFDELEDPTSQLVDLACPIAEVAAGGDAVITKHESLNGFVTEEVVKCQLLYELQGNIYLNSDVKADLTDVTVRQIGSNRVHVYGARGFPPPPTTKLAVFYTGGFQGEMTLNATGYATDLKYDVQEAQLRAKLKEWDMMKDITLLELQRVGVPQNNPRSQLAATSSLRLFVQTRKPETVRRVLLAEMTIFMQHFPGMAGTLDWRLMEPLPFLGYFPAIVKQDEIKEAVVLLGENNKIKRLEVGPPPITEPLKPRASYDAVAPRAMKTFGPTRMVPFGDVVLARSGDKGANVNVGFTPRTRLSNSDEMWEWLRSFLTRARIKEMMGDDWQDWFHIERVEFPRICAVHFVVYGALGRGVSSTARLDVLGKGFAEFLRAVHVPVPVRFLEKGLSSRL